MARNCRDCPVCTRSGAVRTSYLLFVAWWLWMFKWSVTGFMKTCPQCKHLLSRHQRRTDGSFRD